MGLNALQPGCVLEVGASFVLGSGALGHGLSSSHPQELPNSKCCSSMHRGILFGRQKITTAQPKLLSVRLPWLHFSL